jgi:hypothetical protein
MPNRIGLVFFLFAAINLPGQHAELPLEYSIRNAYQMHGNTSYGYWPGYAQSAERTYPELNPSDSNRSGFYRKLYNENLIILNTEDFKLTLDPIFHFMVGIENAENEEQKTIYQNTRGLLIQGALGKKISFYSSFLENQARFPTYMYQFTKETGVAPGSGRVKFVDEDEVDYSMASAGIAWKVNDEFSIKLGYDKDFMGFGYRSLLLSDNAFNYPHLRIDFNWFEGKLRYALNYALLQDLDRVQSGETPEATFKRKTGLFHALTYKPFKTLEFSLFNAALRAIDPAGEEFDYYFHFFVPVIFWNSLINEDETLSKVGLSLRWKIIKDLQVYGQYISGDGPSGWMAGVNWRNALLQNLHVTAEFSYMEEHPREIYDFVLQPRFTFSHYGQSLGHPLGSGFSELFINLSYTYKRFLLQGSANLANRSSYNALIWGYLDQMIDQDNFNSVNMNGQLSYLLNRMTNLQLTLGYNYRELSNGLDKTNYLYVSFRTVLRNVYIDF